LKATNGQPFLSLVQSWHSLEQVQYLRSLGVLRLKSLYLRLKSLSLRLKGLSPHLKSQFLRLKSQISVSQKPSASVFQKPMTYTPRKSNLTATMPPKFTNAQSPVTKQLEQPIPIQPQRTVNMTLLAPLTDITQPNTTVSYEPTRKAMDSERRASAQLKAMKTLGISQNEYNPIIR
jgi:hypothetical protein